MSDVVFLDDTKQASNKVSQGGFGNLLGFFLWMITSLRSMITFINRFLCSVLIMMLNFFCYTLCVYQFIQRYNYYKELKIVLIQTINNIAVIYNNYNQISNIGNREGIEFIVHLMLVIILLCIELIPILIQDFHGNCGSSIHCNNNEDSVNDANQHQKFATQAGAKTKDKRFLNSSYMNNSEFHCVIVVLLIGINIQMIIFQLFHNYSLEQLHLYLRQV